MFKLFKRREKDVYGYLFILPWIIGFLVFTAFPIFYSFYLSFFKIKITTTGIQTTPIKFQNFQNALTVDASFVNKILSFVRDVFVAVPLIVIISLIIAILLNQKIKLRGMFRTIFFLPVIISSGPVLKSLMDKGVTKIAGLDQYLLYKIAASAEGNILATSFIYILDNMIVLLWFSGVQILIFIAALQKIDLAIYEAARIDGASKWEIFWKITLPSLFPMIFVNIIYTTVMYSVSSLNPITAHIKSNMFKLETGFGYASALSWIYFLIITLVMAVIAGIVIYFQRNKD